MMKSKRDPHLDSLRGLAAIAVLVYHALIREGVDQPVNLGLFGVSTFFLISGLIMPQTIERAPTLRAFFRARIFRLWPAYLVAFGVAATLQALGYVPDNWRVVWPGALGLAANVLMLPSVGRVQGLLPVVWTLELEWLFYASLALLWRFGRLDVAPLISAIAIACYLINPSPIALGVALFFMGVTTTQRPRIALILGCALCLCGSIEVVAALCVIGLRRRAPVALAPVGRISYGLYLVHLPLLWIIPVLPALLLCFPAAWGLERLVACMPLYVRPEPIHRHVVGDRSASADAIAELGSGK